MQSNKCRADIMQNMSIKLSMQVERNHIRGRYHRRGFPIGTSNGMLDAVPHSMSNNDILFVAHHDRVEQFESNACGVMRALRVPSHIRQDVCIARRVPPSPPRFRATCSMALAPCPAAPLPRTAAPSLLRFNPLVARTLFIWLLVHRAPQRLGA